MSHAHDNPTPGREERTLNGLAPRLTLIGLIAAAAGIVLGVVIALLGGGEHRMVLLGQSYLVGWSFFLTVSLSALFFVIIHHLVRAGWSTTVRRILELMSMNLITLAALAIPVLIMVPWIYHHWVHPEPGDMVMAGKAAWLNVPFFIGRIVFYFALWIAMAWWFYRNSVRQDETGDVALTQKMQSYSGGFTVLFALSLNWAAFDILMSLDPHWYSTVFGVYIFGGANLALFSVLTLFVSFIQKRGVLTHSITREHYHDFGKWMFAWTFFWGYISFSQYMLIWYGNIPEETVWFFRRGASTHDGYANIWTVISLTLLFGHLLIPFAWLLSRHVKRRANLLAIPAIWMVVFHFLDLAWVVLPESRIIDEMVKAEVEVGMGAQTGALLAQLGAAACFTVGVGGLWLVGLVKLAGNRPIIPVADPRLPESVAFHNI